MSRVVPAAHGRVNEKWLGYQHDSGYRSPMHAYDYWTALMSRSGRVLMLYPDDDAAVPEGCVAVYGPRSVVPPDGATICAPSAIGRQAMPADFSSAWCLVLGPALRMTQRAQVLGQAVAQGLVGDECVIMEVLVSEDPRALADWTAARAAGIRGIVKDAHTATVHIRPDTVLVLHSTSYPRRPGPASQSPIPDAPPE